MMMLKEKKMCINENKHKHTTSSLGTLGRVFLTRNDTTLNKKSKQKEKGLLFLL